MSSYVISRRDTDDSGKKKGNPQTTNERTGVETARPKHSTSGATEQRRRANSTPTARHEQLREMDATRDVKYENKKKFTRSHKNNNKRILNVGRLV